MYVSLNASHTVYKENFKSQRLLGESDTKHGSIITPLANSCLCNMIYILPPLPLYRNTQMKTPHTQAFSHTLRHLRQFGAFSNPICQYKEALLVSNVNELNMPSTGMCESRGPGSLCVCPHSHIFKGVATPSLTLWTWLAYRQSAEGSELKHT